MRVILATGGTGGHVQPAIALAQQIQDAIPGAEIVFTSGTRAQESKWIHDAGYECHQVHCSTLSGSLVKRASAPAKIALGIFECLALIRRFNPDVVLGFGGYTSFPPLCAASILRKPAILLEQNVVPGRTNRLLARVVDEVHSQWAEARKFFHPKANVLQTGNPVRKEVLKVIERARPKRDTLLVMGGSQGASAINHIMVEAMPLIRDALPGLPVIHLTGVADEDWARNTYEEMNIEGLEVHGYLVDMPRAYERAALAVCRAGGTSIAELSATGIPAILVPYPYAADDHQTHNALAMESCGAGIMVSQEEATPQRIAELIIGLFQDTPMLEKLQEQSESMAIRNAGERILERLRSLIEHRRGMK